MGVVSNGLSKLVSWSSTSTKMPFPLWITLYRGQVAAAIIKSCTMVWNNDAAESLTIGECHEMATMSLHKATGPFSLYDTWKGNQPSLKNTRCPRNSYFLSHFSFHGWSINSCLGWLLSTSCTVPVWLKVKILNKWMSWHRHYFSPVCGL